MSYFLPPCPSNTGSFLSSVSTLSDLSTLNIDNLDNGAIIYIPETDDIYTLNLTDDFTPDGATIISANGSGYWISRIEGRWDDQQGDISEGDGGNALTYEEFRDTPWKIFCMRHDQNDELHFRFQFSHTWKYNTAVFPHLHMLPLADPSSTEIAYFDAYHTWSRPDYSTEPVPSISEWTWTKVQISIEPGDAYVQKIVSFGSITPPSWARESSILLLFIRRLGTDPVDTYDTSKDHGLNQANIGLLSADIHYRKDTSGSLIQYPT